MNFEAIIGLELHVEMKTKSKMFSSSPVIYGASPNTQVLPFDIGFPGTMPSVNKQAVINAIRVCHALHMTIDDELWFDRKNYFYSDLPKGYQITQQNRPIGSHGYIDIESTNGTKKINIERLHLEEDTCKQLHNGKYTYLDYNRAGVPLLEIVSYPEIKNGEEAMKYVEKIRSIVTFLDVSNGKMEEGSLRCDVNISIRPIGKKEYGTKVEIKNLNSLANIQKVIDWEIKRQQSLLLSGKAVEQETRRYDENSKKTILMRIKTDEVDYKCFTEPNIVPIKLEQEFIKKAILSSPELAENKIARYKKLGLNDYDAQLLVNNKAISEYFDKVIAENVNIKLAANWMNVDVQSVLNKNNISIDEFKLSPKNLARLINLIEKGQVSNKQARELFKTIQINDDDPNDLLKSIGTSIINDEQELLKIINAVLIDNPQSIVDYRNGKDRVVGYIVGKVMKITNGKASPSLTNKLVVTQLKGEKYA